MILAEGITLYHGSYARVAQPDLAMCRAGKDFGRGFYLTTDYSQAKKFVRSSIGKAIAEGRITPDSKVGFVSSFTVGDITGLNYLEFEDANDQWLQCVVAHRRSIESAMEAWQSYDVIAGKIANDNTNLVITTYMDGVYGSVGSARASEIAISLLEPQNLKDQVCMRTQKALECLSFLGCEEVTL